MNPEDSGTSEVDELDAKKLRHEDVMHSSPDLDQVGFYCLLPVKLRKQEL